MVDNVLVDAAESVGDLTLLEQEVRAAGRERVAAPSKQKAPKEKQQTANEDDVPEKYRGKSIRDVIEMHRQLETKYGQQSNDLGTQRHMTDVLLGLKRERDLQRNEAPAKVQINGDELLANPTEAVERVVASREQAQSKRLDALEQDLAASRFAQRHPDFQKFANDEEFKTWVAASPLRVRAAQAAHSGNWDIAGDLLDEYKVVKASQRKTETDEEAGNTEEEVHPLKAARAAAFESSSQGNSGAKSGKKIYKRSDVMRLMINKPETYYSEEFQAEIMPAYAEGRVR